METFEKEFYRRNLPHWQPKGGIFNICFRLAGTLPKEKWLALRDERTLKITELRNSYDFLSQTAFSNLLQKEESLYFGKFDDLLDDLSTGPQFLKFPNIGIIVAESIIYLDKENWFNCICYCIMQNHVHLIIRDIKKPLFKILQSLKTFTAIRANRELNRQGKVFWQKESYDNLVRDDHDLLYKIEYILNNPVKAKLVKDWKTWPFSYVKEEYLSLL